MPFPLNTVHQQQSAAIIVKMCIQNEEGMIIRKKPMFSVPNENILSFRYNMMGGGSDISASLTLYDSYDQGRGKEGTLDFILLKMWAIAETVPIITVNFGWQNNMSGDLYFAVTGTQYNFGDNGLTATLQMMPEFNVPLSAYTTFDKNISLKQKQPVFHFDLFKQLFAEYNKVQTNPKYKLTKPEPIYINCPEIERKETEPLAKDFAAAGKKFFSCVEDLVISITLKKNNNDSEAISRRYEWCLYGDKEGEHFVYIWGFDPKKYDDVFKIRRHYKFRCGKESNVLNFSYSEFPYAAVACGAVDKAIEVHYTEGGEEGVKKLRARDMRDLEKIREGQPWSLATSRQDLEKIKEGQPLPSVTSRHNVAGQQKTTESRLNFEGPQRTKEMIYKEKARTFGLKSKLAKRKIKESMIGITNANILYCSEDSDQYVNSAVSAKQILRTAYENIEKLSMPNVTLSVLGDPKFQFIPPYYNMTSAKRIGNDPENVEVAQNQEWKKWVGPLSTINLTVNNPSGGETFFSGKYVITGFTHEIVNAGNFTTTISALRRID